MGSFVYDAFGRKDEQEHRRNHHAIPLRRRQSGAGVGSFHATAGAVPTANLLTGLGIDEYFQRSDSVNGTLTFLNDALGSPLALTDSSGAITTSYTYEPFGKVSVTNPPLFNPNTYQFAGRENDSTGLYFYRARYYSPTYQRFITQDPIGISGGDTNLYGFVGNNPISHVDPLGTRDSRCSAPDSRLPEATLWMSKRPGHSTWPAVDQ